MLADASHNFELGFDSKLQISEQFYISITPVSLGLLYTIYGKYYF